MVDIEKERHSLLDAAMEHDVAAIHTPELVLEQLAIKEHAHRADRARQGIGEKVDAVGRFMDEAGAMPLLTAEEEVQLAKVVQRGQEASRDLKQKKIRYDEADDETKRLVDNAELARDYFIRANLRLAVDIAKRYKLPKGTELLDLVQEGVFGLHRASEKFDWQKGFKFSTYASKWIRQRIKHAINTTLADGTTMPERKRQNLKFELMQLEGDTSTLSPELAGLELLASCSSLNDKVRIEGEDSPQEVQDKLPDRGTTVEEVVLAQQAGPVLAKLLGTLHARQRNMLEAHFMDGKSYREVGEEFGVSQQAANMAVRAALRKLRQEAEYQGVDIGTFSA